MKKFGKSLKMDKKTENNFKKDKISNISDGLSKDNLDKKLKTGLISKINLELDGGKNKYTNFKFKDKKGGQYMVYIYCSKHYGKKFFRGGVYLKDENDFHEGVDNIGGTVDLETFANRITDSVVSIGLKDFTFE